MEEAKENKKSKNIEKSKENKKENKKSNNKKENNSNNSNDSTNVNKVNKKYKDSFFVSLFSDKESIIDLYNAIEGTNYTYNTKIDIITLEGVVYRGKY